jgi:hypothetical protein
MVQLNACGEFNPPPPETNAIGCPAALTGVKYTLPVAIGTPPILMWLAVIVVNCADATPASASTKANTASFLRLLR